MDGTVAERRITVIAEQYMLAVVVVEPANQVTIVKAQIL
jgi:hypothetical protein